MEPILPGSSVDQAVSEVVGYSSFGGAFFLAGQSSFLQTPRKTPERGLGPGSVSSSSSGSGGGSGSGSGDPLGQEQTVMPQLPSSASDRNWAIPPGEQQFKLTLMSIFESYRDYRPLDDLRDKIRSAGQSPNASVRSARDQLEGLLEQAGLAAFVNSFRSARDWSRLREPYTEEMRGLQVDAIYSMTRVLPQEQRIELRKKERESQ